MTLEFVEMTMMLTTDCPSIDELRALTNGQLADEQSDELWGHVRECEDCRSELETVAGGEDSLIVALRDHDDHAGYSDEPGCKLAVAKALGALSSASDSAAANEDESLPKRFGEYEIHRPLGRGGMGSVFLARHTKLGREVALKILSSHRLADPRMRQRFEAEMRAVGKLSHPNIVTAHDARDVGGTAVLVTEYIDGLDLGQLVTRTGPLAVADACEVIRQVAMALQYTSDQGFVHRDVKPSNIMLSARGEVKLLDLGLARFQHGEEPSEMTGTGQTMGTANYVAPEQVTDSRSVDVRADIYSLGCTLFKLLTGAAPFADPAHVTAFAKMTAHVSTQPPSLAQRLPAAPSGLVRLVNSMIAKPPTQRPQAPRDVAQALAAYTQGSDLQRLSEHAAATHPATAFHPASIAPASSAARPQSLLRRRIPISVAIASGLLGMLLGFAMGIVITITKPDGSKMTLNVPDGSSIDIQEGPASDQAVVESIRRPSVPLAVSPPAPTSFDLPNPGTVWPNALSSPNSASPPLPGTFHGVWMRIDPDRAAIKRAEREPIKDSVVHPGSISFVAFDAKSAYMAMPNSQPQLCSVLFNSGSMHGKTEVPDPYPTILSNNSPFLSGVCRLTSEGDLQIQFHDKPPFVGPGDFDGADPSDGSVTTFERIGDLPKDFSEATAIYHAIPPAANRTFTSLMMVVQHGDSHVRMQTELKEKLKQIGVAFHNFHDVHKKFPGSANLREGGRDATGEFPFSWRVALLPFLEHDDLFTQYRFDEPWDSEHNRTLLDKMPEVYRGLDDQTRVGKTHFQGYVGEQTAIGSQTGEPLTSFTDGVSRTLLIADYGLAIPWTQPQDLPFEPAGDWTKLSGYELPFRFRLTTKIGPNNSVMGQQVAIPWDFTYLMADGSVHTMAQLFPEKLAKLITRNGGEPVDP